MSRYRVVLGCLACLALAFALVACSPDSGGNGNSGGGYGGGGMMDQRPSGETAGKLTVVEKDLAFDPATLEVGVGDTVTFVNEDSAPHNVKIDGKDLGNQSQGQSVTWKAEKTGTFPYTCTIHPSMKGEITVK